MQAQGQEEQNLVQVEYTGEDIGSRTYTMDDGTSYRAGNNKRSKIIQVAQQHVPELLARGPFKVLETQAETQDGVGNNEQLDTTAQGQLESQDAPDPAQTNPDLAQQKTTGGPSATPDAQTHKGPDADADADAASDSTAKTSTAAKAKGSK